MSDQSWSSVIAGASAGSGNSYWTYPGQYTAVVVDALFSKNRLGRPMLVVECEVTGVTDAGETSHIVGEGCSTVVMLDTDWGPGNAKQALAGIVGVDPSSLSAGVIDKIVARSHDTGKSILAGKEVIVVVTEKQGKNGAFVVANYKAG